MLSLFDIRNYLINGTSIYDIPLKVTYYARVSTDKYEQLNSLENQVNYYTNYIKENSNWTFVEGYVDEGISGTSTNKRSSFKRMIRDAKEGKFNLIITKEISRFARDTLDSISFTRKLLEYGVGVLFQYDHINTFNSDSELRLTIMASIAQEEVRKLSERVKFGFQRSIDKGKVLGNDFIWGYKKDKCRLVIVEEEALIIRKIYDMYVNCHLGMRSIGKKLAMEGIFNKNGNVFSQGTIKYILTNPKYKGYYCGNKTRIVDYHTKQKVNISKEDWKMYEDNLNVPPIVSEQIWNKAQEIISLRTCKYSNKRAIYHNKYPFSGKIYCMNHGSNYTRKINTSSGKKKKKIITWRCNSNDYDNDPILYEYELKELVARIILKYVSNVSVVLELINEYKRISCNWDFSKEKEKVEKQINYLEKKKEKILDLIVNGVIKEEDFKKQIDEISCNIESLKGDILLINSKEKARLNDIDFWENIRKEALKRLEFGKIDIDSLLWEFLDKIEVSFIRGNDYVNLKIFLNNKSSYDVFFKHKKHPFGSYYTHDKSRC